MYCTGKMLRENKGLTSLQLQRCGIGPEGLSELCSALEENTTLTSLNLRENAFDDHKLASLGKLLIHVITVAGMSMSKEVFEVMVTESSEQCPSILRSCRRAQRK